MINECLQKHFFMRSLDTKTRETIITEMSVGKIVKGTTLFKQNSFGDYFYILKEGSISLYINDIFVKTIAPGESFGELALLHTSPRSGTVKATTDCLLYCLERTKFKKIAESLNEKGFNENKLFIKSIAILGNILN